MCLIQEKAGEFIRCGVFCYKERELQKIGQKRKRKIVDMISRFDTPQLVYISFVKVYNSLVKDKPIFH